VAQTVKVRPGLTGSTCTGSRGCRRYGEPAFCKIDVEGFEIGVLAGLTRPLRALSFEYLSMAHAEALAVLAAVEALGGGRYNYSPVETTTWASDRSGGRSGDV
jgi:hypothetical protein